MSWTIAAMALVGAWMISQGCITAGQRGFIVRRELGNRFVAWDGLADFEQHAQVPRGVARSRLVARLGHVLLVGRRGRRDTRRSRDADAACAFMSEERARSSAARMLLAD